MPIGVLLKQVPDTTAKIGVSGGRVDESAVSKWSMSPYDEYALESALKLKEAGGDVVCRNHLWSRARWKDANRCSCSRCRFADACTN